MRSRLKYLYSNFCYFIINRRFLYAITLQKNARQVDICVAIVPKCVAFCYEIQANSYPEFTVPKKKYNRHDRLKYVTAGAAIQIPYTALPIYGPHAAMPPRFGGIFFRFHTIDLTN